MKAYIVTPNTASAEPVAVFTSQDAADAFRKKFASDGADFDRAINGMSVHVIETEHMDSLARAKHQHFCAFIDERGEVVEMRNHNCTLWWFSDYARLYHNHVNSTPLNTPAFAIQCDYSRLGKPDTKTLCVLVAANDKEQAAAFARDFAAPILAEYRKENNACEA